MCTAEANWFRSVDKGPMVPQRQTLVGAHAGIVHAQKELAKTQLILQLSHMRQPFEEALNMIRLRHRKGRRSIQKALNSAFHRWSRICLAMFSLFLWIAWHRIGTPVSQTVRATSSENPKLGCGCCINCRNMGASSQNGHWL